MVTGVLTGTRIRTKHDGADITMKPKNDHDTLREAQAEALTAGALVVILSLFLLGNMQEPLAMTLAGAVLLGSGVYQSQQGWHVALTTWLLGLVLFLGGIGVRLFLVAYLRINWVEIALVAIGGYLIWQNLFRRR
jgi:hypothetical protein